MPDVMTANVFNDFYDYVLRGVYDFRAAGDTQKIMLSNVAPVATNSVKADLTEISAGNGYVAGGEDFQNDLSPQGGTAQVTAQNVAWIASGGAIATFQYLIWYDDTPTSPADPLIAWWDYGAAVDLAAGESFTLYVPT